MPNTNVKHIIDSMGTAARVNRLKAADYFIENPEKINELIKLVFETSYKFHHKAAWVLEFVLKNHIDWLVPHIYLFSNSLLSLRIDSAIRPTAKICQWIAYEYVQKKNMLFIKNLNKNHINNIVEASFDWLIGDYKVASKVYSMDTLYYFGCLSNPESEWVHIELKNILLQKSYTGSPGYKAHARKILAVIT